MARLLCSLTGAQISGMKFSKTPWFTKCVTLRLGDGRMIRTGQRSGRAWLESRGKHCKTAVRRHDERDRESRQIGIAAVIAANCVALIPLVTHCYDLSVFIQFVILAVLRTLQGQLKCEAALRDLVDPYPPGQLQPLPSKLRPSRLLWPQRPLALNRTSRNPEIVPAPCRSRRRTPR